jgi:glutathione synthase
MGVVMDPIESINPKKDSTLAMMLAAQRRDWKIHYLQPQDITYQQGELLARSQAVTVHDDLHHWADLEAPVTHPLSDFQVMLMRTDPPFNMEYIYGTYLLEMAQIAGVLVVNHPQALRDVNEKFFITRFPDCIPPTLVSRDPSVFRAFLAQQQDIVVKPLDGMGGASIFRIRQGDPNTNVILETILRHGTTTVMAQRFLPEFQQGDKRILLVDGKPVDFALARIPASGEARANLATGGTGKGVALTERDRYICDQVAPELKRRGLMFVGLDVIGNYLTEINVTSPTCIRELDAIYGLDIAGDLMDAIAAKLAV